MCVDNCFADLFFCIVPEQNHNDHYQYFTSVMHLYICVCSFVVGTVVLLLIVHCEPIIGVSTFGLVTVFLLRA